MHNFYIDTLGRIGDEVLLPASEAKHLFRTLRASRGDIIGLLDGKGGSGQAEIADNKKITLRSVNRQPEPLIRVHLFVAPPKRSKMDQLLRQCTEAGVWAIHPVISKYSVAAPEKTSGRWTALLQEACKQSGNPFLPEIHPPCTLEAALKNIRNANMTAFYGAVNPDRNNIVPAANSDIAWLVGPEGGFSPEEEQLIGAAGVSPLNLGHYIMRVETAAVCGITLLNFYNKDTNF